MMFDWAREIFVWATEISSGGSSAAVYVVPSSWGAVMRRKTSTGLTEGLCVGRPVSGRLSGMAAGFCRKGVPSGSQKRWGPTSRSAIAKTSMLKETVGGTEGGGCVMHEEKIMGRSTIGVEMCFMGPPRWVHLRS